MLLRLSSCLIESLGSLLDGRVDFSSNVAFETADDFALAHPLRGSTSHVRRGAQFVTWSDYDDTKKICIGLAVSTAVEPKAVGLADDAGIGFTPHSEAEAASERIRSGLLPAAISRAAAVPGPTPRVWTRAGATDRVSRSISAFRPRTSSLS